jgi:hypothetical protein
MAEHWQREIAYFDLLIAFVFGWSARQADPGIKRAATMLLCGLSLLLGENHLEGWLTEARPFHVLFTLGNGLAVLWGLVACFSVRPGAGMRAASVHVFAHGLFIKTILFHLVDGLGQSGCCCR